LLPISLDCPFVIAASVFSDVSLLPVCNVNKTMLNRCILNFREWFKATKQMKYMYSQKMSRIIRLTGGQSEILEDGRQIQDVHNSYSPIYTARFIGNSNAHDQVMENYRRTLNTNYRRNPQPRQNGNTHKQRYRDYP
jgi:hypothetical protein